VGGQRHRRSLKTRDWQRAIRKLVAMEDPTAPLVVEAIAALERRTGALETALEASNPEPIDPARVQAALSLASEARFEQGEIYFAKADGRIKIGFAARSRSRLSSLQTASGAQLILLLSIKGNRDTERGFHSIFSREHVRGEWFHASDTLLEFSRKATEVPKC